MTKNEMISIMLDKYYDLEGECYISECMEEILDAMIKAGMIIPCHLCETEEHEYPPQEDSCVHEWEPAPEPEIGTPEPLAVFAIKDYREDGEIMMRCPYCNAWDRAWDSNGTYQCEECDKWVKVKL